MSKYTRVLVYAGLLSILTAIMTSHNTIAIKLLLVGVLCMASALIMNGVDDD